MKIEIRNVADKGNPQKERLILRARSETDIGEYVLIQCGFSPDGVTVETFHTMWFPYKPIPAGDLVVVYTKHGADREKILNSGRTAHFFYLGLDHAIWDRKDRAPVILYAPEWVSKDPDEL
jgi:hypothetical protein